MAAVIPWCHSHGDSWANDQSEYVPANGLRIGGEVVCQDNAGDVSDFGYGIIINLPYPSAW